MQWKIDLECSPALKAFRTELFSDWRQLRIIYCLKY